MRDITIRAASAFHFYRNLKLGNTKVVDGKMYLHGNLIAEQRADGVYITNAGWFTNVTKERLNGISGVDIVQKNWDWYLNDKKWNGEWIRVI